MASTATTTRTSARGASVGICAAAEYRELGIEDLLERGGHTAIAWHEQPTDAIETARNDAPELFLFVSARADSEVLERIGDLKDASDETEVILICKRSGNGEVRKALDAGVAGLVALAELQEVLSPVIDVVRAGQVSVPAARGKELRKRILTSREKQILGLVVMGMTNAEIASKLFLAESTVKSHLSSAFAKLGVASRSEAASVILDPRSGAGLGILTIPSS